MHKVRGRWNSQTWTCNSLHSSGFKLALILVYYNVRVQVIVLGERKAKILPYQTQKTITLWTKI